jgi:hypothetical protein
LGRIPWHECVRWAEREGLDEEEIESLIDLIERLDVEEIKLDAPVEKKRKDVDYGEDGAARA